MGKIQDLLKQYHAEDLESLSPEETESFFKLLQQTEQKELTLDKLKIGLS